MNARILQVALLIITLSFLGCKNEVTFIQLCDPQLGMGGYQEDMERFNRAVESIDSIEPDFVVICGDFVHHASDSSFSDFQSIAQKLEIPYLLAPGNHDVLNSPNDSSLSEYRSRFGEDYFLSQFGEVTMVIINTQLIKEDIGAASTKHFEWLSGKLDSLGTTQQKVFVAGHYPIYLKNVEEDENYSNLPKSKRQVILDLFESNDVLAYLSGHRHELLINDYNGILLITGETTSKNFDERPFGFRKWTVSDKNVSHEFVKL